MFDRDVLHAGAEQHHAAVVGADYGFRPTIPHIMGITVGFAFMIGAVGLGLGTIFIAYPVLQTILKYAGVTYLVYLAAHIALSEPPSAEQDNSRGPMTFWGAAMFQWVNAKGWVMVIGTITAYAGLPPLNIGCRSSSLLIGACRVSLGPFGTAAAGADLADGGAGLQYRDGGAAAGLALPGLHGRMMPHRAMQKRVSQKAKNALDNAGNSRATGAPS